jgi:hypothetical protein
MDVFTAYFGKGYPPACAPVVRSDERNMYFRLTCINSSLQSWFYNPLTH